MGVKKDPETLLAISPIPGDPNPKHDEWKNWKIGGISAGFVVLGGIGAYLAYKAHKKRRR